MQKSLAEGFGLPVTEAMWKARPVVAGRVGGIRDQIDDEVNGVLIDPRDHAGVWRSGTCRRATSVHIWSSSSNSSEEVSAVLRLAPDRSETDHATSTVGTAAVRRTWRKPRNAKTASATPATMSAMPTYRAMVATVHHP